MFALNAVRTYQFFIVHLFSRLLPQNVSVESILSIHHFHTQAKAYSHASNSRRFYHLFFFFHFSSEEVESIHN